MVTRRQIVQCWKGKNKYPICRNNILSNINFYKNIVWKEFFFLILHIMDGVFHIFSYIFYLILTFPSRLLDPGILTFGDSP